jgi:hypothetical protein
MARKARPKRARKPTDTVKLNLRFSELLHRRLVREAKKRNCSLNTEIVERLEWSFLSEIASRRTPLPAIAARALLASLDKAVVGELISLFLHDEPGDDVAPGYVGREK